MRDLLLIDLKPLHVQCLKLTLRDIRTITDREVQVPDQTEIELATSVLLRNTLLHSVQSLYGLPEAEMNVKDIEYKRQHGLCFYCSQKRHLKRDCPTKPPNRNRSASREPEPKKESTDINTRVVTVKPMPKITAQKVYLDIEVNRFKTLGLVDTGCNISLIPYTMEEGVELEALDVQLYPANGKCQYL